MFSDSDLVSLCKRGIVCGPGESTQCFSDRVVQRQKISPSEMSCQVELARYDLAIDWLSIEYKKKRSICYGAEVDLSQSIKKPTLRIFNNPFLALYGKKFIFRELLAHENIHLAREMFDEPAYEEIIAYSSSPFAYRRYLGPLFSRNIAMLSFMILCLFPLLFSISGWLLSLSSFLVAASGVFFVAVSMKEVWRLKKFSITCKKLKVVFSEKYFMAVACRLTDNEVSFFAKSSLSKIKEYIERQSSLRWQQIKLTYAI